MTEKGPSDEDVAEFKKYLSNSSQVRRSPSIPRTSASAPKPEAQKSRPSGPTPALESYVGNYSVDVPRRSVGLLTAVGDGFAGYFNFRTRSSRSEFWWWFAFSRFAMLVIAGLDLYLNRNNVPPTYLLIVGVQLALIIPDVSVSVRRLHDTDRSGWHLLLSLVPFGSIFLLIWFLERGTRGANRFGPEGGSQFPRATGPVPPLSSPASQQPIAPVTLHHQTSDAVLPQMEVRGDQPTVALIYCVECGLKLVGSAPRFCGACGADVPVRP